MSTEFRTDSLESEKLIAADQPDSTMLIEVDTANPSPMTIAIAETIAYILATRDRYIQSTPKRRRRRQAPDSPPSASSQAQSTLSHHVRHCTICHHPERQASKRNSSTGTARKPLPSIMQSACARFIATLEPSGFSSAAPSTCATPSAISSKKCNTPRSLQTPSSTRFTPTRTSRQPGAGLKSGRSSSPPAVRRGSSTHPSSRT